MRNAILLIAGASLLAVPLAAGAAQACRYSAPRNAQIDAAGLQRLAIRIGPDDLVIHGQPGLTKVVVQGTACASNEQWLQDVKLEASRHGDIASVVARDHGHGVHLSLFGGSYAYLKLDVRVPATLAVKLDQGSGDAHANNLAALDATLGSGDLKVDGIAGEFGLDVGSGDVVARDVGSLRVSGVASGDASVDGVHGDAHVGRVGSGGLDLRNARGNVTLGAISSGDAKLQGVGGSVQADGVGSGELVIRDVTGDVTIGPVSSGEVSIERAGGSVRADSVGSGSLDADGVGGSFCVNHVGSGDVSKKNVKGGSSIPCSNG